MSAPSRDLRPGVYVPTAAFFHPDSEEVDAETTGRHAVRLAGAAVTGLVVQGSTGEAVHLTADDRSRITAVTRRSLDDAGYRNVLLLAGCGAQSTRETIHLCGRAAEDGADHVLVLPPTYYHSLLDRDDVIAFFRAVADASPLPVVIYNYPAVTAGVDLDSDAIAALSHHPNIVGCKFTCADTGKIGRVAASVRDVGDRFFCFAGSADFIVSSVAAGATGVIAGLANVAPRTTVRLFTLAAAGAIVDGDSAATAAADLQAVVGRADWVLIRSGLVGIKAALVQLLGYGGWARRPLPRPDQTRMQAIADGLRDVFALEETLP